ncbi:MAG: nitroreductase family protein [Acidimicrobiia bacterium]
MSDHSASGFVPYRLSRPDPETFGIRGRELHAEADSRRSVRSFSTDPVPKEAIEWAILTASTAPSGAHMQPWTFVLVSDPDIRRQIRSAAEEEESQNYLGGRINEEWRTALEPLGTDWKKPFLETAPWLVVLFEQRYGVLPDGSQRHHYYVKESVGMAAGMFIWALHRLGLATLTHTPSPMRFLNTILDRPENERPFVVMPIGYPADNCEVPDLHRKALDQVMVEC